MGKSMTLRETAIRRCHGFTLVELMIALAIGMIILGALTVMFVNQTKVRAELDKSNRMTDNGRFAVQLLSENIQLAGFYGEYDPSLLAVPAMLPDPCSTAAADIAAALPLPVQSYNASNASATIAARPSCIPSSMIKAGSDILVIRRVETTSILQTAAVNGTHYFQASLCQHDTTAQYKLSTTAADFTLRQKNCTVSSTTPYSNVRRMLVQIYFVSPYNRPGDGIPTLKRLELVPTGWNLPAGTLLADGSISSSATVTSAPGFILTPLVEGIEYLQLTYGLDTDTSDGKGLADSYSDALADGTQMSQVVEAKIYLVARNIEASAGYSDPRTYDLGSAGTVGVFTGTDATYKRQAYAQLVRVTNVVGRREIP